MFHLLNLRQTNHYNLYANVHAWVDIQNVSCVLYNITHGNTNAYVCTDRVLTLSKLNQRDTLKFANLRVNTNAHVWTNRVLTRSKLDWTETHIFEPRRRHLLQFILCLSSDKRKTNSLCCNFELIVRKQLECIQFVKFTEKQPLKCIWKHTAWVNIYNVSCVLHRITHGHTNAYVCTDRVLTLSKLNQQETTTFANLPVNAKAHFCPNRVLTRSKLDWTETHMFEPRRRHVVISFYAWAQTEEINWMCCICSLD